VTGHTPNSIHDGTRAREFANLDRAKTQHAAGQFSAKQPLVLGYDAFTAMPKHAVGVNEVGIGSKGLEKSLHVTSVPGLRKAFGQAVQVVGAHSISLRAAASSLRLDAA
jgi:hypothetical protein